MLNKNRNYKKIGWWTSGILLALVAVLGVTAIYLSSKWKPLLTTKIKEGVYENSHHLYRIDFKDIHLNLFSGNIVLDSLKLIPDTTVFNQLKISRKAPTHLFRIKLAHLKLSRVGILTAYFKKKIKINSIVLDHPSIDMIYYKIPKQRDTVDKNKTLYQQISKTIKSIRINNISVVDADFDYYSGTKKLNAVQHLKIDVKDVLIDSLAQYDTTRVLHSKNIGFELIGYQSVTKNKMYTIKADTIRGSISRKTLLVKALRMIPMYPDLTFSRKHAVQKDRYDLNFSKISVTGIDFVGLNNDGDLHAKRIAIGAAKVAVFLDRSLPMPRIDKGINFPHRALKRLPIATFIDTISLNKVDIAYTEFNPATQERGTLRLENLSGNILNVTNDSLRLTKKNHAYANLRTAIMGVGEMNVKIDFNLTDPNAAFSYVGHVNGFNMQVLNPLSRSLGLVEIKTGMVRKVDFSISANERGSSGSVVFLYNNLKVNLLEENGGVKEKKGLLSFLANAILIINDNPEKGEPIRVSHIKWRRVPQASFFNLMWKSVFVGIREAVGLGSVPMKGVPKTKTKKEIRKERRAERKAARMKNRQ